MLSTVPLGPICILRMRVCLGTLAAQQPLQQVPQQQAQRLPERLPAARAATAGQTAAAVEAATSAAAAVAAAVTTVATAVTEAAAAASAQQMRSPQKAPKLRKSTSMARHTQKTTENQGKYYQVDFPNFQEYLRGLIYPGSTFAVITLNMGLEKFAKRHGYWILRI